MKNNEIFLRDNRQILAGCENGGNGPYMRYRIPGLVVTKQDTLLMVYEARMSPGDDWADMDILLFRSTDGGETFDEPQILASGAANGRTVNNPVLLVGQDGTLHFLYCVEYGVCTACGDAADGHCPHGVGVFYRQSTDDGLSWSAPRNITHATHPEARYAIALGPGHGICLPDGTLLVPLWQVEKQNLRPDDPQGIRAHHTAGVATLYSCDNGATWQMGEKLPSALLPDGKIADHNESACALTSTGQVFMTTRSHEITYRATAWSPDGHSRWTPLQLNAALPDAVCMGSVAAYCQPNHPYTLLHVNCPGRLHNIRTGLWLQASTDDGKSWQRLSILTEGDSGYSDIAVDSQGTVYVVYEQQYGRKCNLVRLHF